MIINYGPLLLQLNPLSDILIKYGSNTTFETLSSSGVTDVYSIYKNSDGWALSIYQDCQLQISKSILSCDIGGCGGGGGGGKYGTAENAQPSAGGGGGSGGYVTSIIGVDLTPGIYDVTCGAGGAAKTDGSATSLVKDSTNIFIASGGVKGGNAKPSSSYSEQYGTQVWYAGGNGGTSAGCSSGGKGATGAGKTPGQGADGQYIFSESIFISLTQDQPDYILVAAGGGGGNGYNLNGAGNPGLPGNSNLTYGQGGLGGDTQVGKAGSPGYGGMLMIRQSYN